MSIEPQKPVSEGHRRLVLSWQHVVLAVILLLATFLRMWQLDSVPPGLAHDEAYNGLDALTLLERGTFPVFHEGWEIYEQEAHEDRPVRNTAFPVFLEGNYGREPAIVYLMAASVWIFGSSPFALRFVPAILGVLAVFGTYLAALSLQSLSNRAVGSKNAFSESTLTSLLPLLAALTMAILYPAVTFSRYGVRAMAFVPLETLVIYCFWRGVTSSEELTSKNPKQGTNQAIYLGAIKPGWFLLSGLLLGLSLYTYAAARFLPFVFVTFFIYWFLRDREAMAKQWANIAVMFVASIIAALPLLIFLLQQPYYLLDRSKFVANRGAGTYPGQPWLTWLTNIGRVAAGIFFNGDSSLRRNLPGRPFLDWIQGFLLIAGLIGIAWRRFRRRDVFLIIWLGIMLLPGVLSGDAPHFGRLIGAAAPMAIIVSLGAVWIAGLLYDRFAHRSDYAIVIIGVVLMVLFMTSAAKTTWDYFQRYAKIPEMADAFQLSDWQLGQYASTLPAGATVYLTPNQQKMATIYFALGGQEERLRTFHSPLESLTPAGQPDRSSIYLIRPYAQAVLDRLTTIFPVGVVDKSAPSFHAFWLFEEAAIQSSRQPSDISWGGAISLLEWTTDSKDDVLIVNLTWQAIVEMTRDYTVFVHILAQDGTLVAQNDRQPDGYPTSDWQQNEVVLDTFEVVLPDNLEPGTYLLQSGLYYLPTLERLGEPLILGEIEIP